MKKTVGLSLFASLMFSGAALHAAVIYGGIEDTQHTSTELNGDFNDLIFSLSGNLSILGAGSLFDKPVLSETTPPYWNNASLDGKNMNVGFCIYGGGGCNGGVPLSSDPGTKYYALAGGAAPDSILFSDSGSSVVTLMLSISADTNSLYWYNPASPWNLHSLTGGTFTPSATFGLATSNGLGQWRYSQDSLDKNGERSETAQQHFAMFSSTGVPEPGSLGLIGLGLIGLAVVNRRRQIAAR
jgi:PEP-CTERM motif-containing protein